MLLWPWASLHDMTPSSSSSPSLIILFFLLYTLTPLSYPPPSTTLPFPPNLCGRFSGHHVVRRRLRRNETRAPLCGWASANLASSGVGLLPLVPPRDGDSTSSSVCGRETEAPATWHFRQQGQAGSASQVLPRKKSFRYFNLCS